MKEGSCFHEKNLKKEGCDKEKDVTFFIAPAEVRSCYLFLRAGDSPRRSRGPPPSGGGLKKGLQRLECLVEVVDDVVDML
ncbi:MAG: hypothetical protein ACI4OD_02005, partial [Selenomonas sp.]